MRTNMILIDKLMNAPIAAGVGVALTDWFGVIHYNDIFQSVLILMSIVLVVVKLRYNILLTKKLKKDG